jgi:hypothetical protein
MTRLIYAAQDGALAERIERDFQDVSGQVIVILSPAAAQDEQVQAAINQSLDKGERLIPVLAAPTPLPEIIEHLEPVDFSVRYDADALRARLTDAGTPMKVRTPAVRKLNRFDGYFMLAVVLFCFVVGLFFVAGGVIRNPDAEYAAVETEIVLTRNYYVDANLPHSTQEAAEFASTVQAAPTALRPFLSATATAVAGGG